MRIALAQMNPTSGDIEGNTARDPRGDREPLPRAAPTSSSRPEMALPGYCIGDLVEDAGFLAANERAMQRDRGRGARNHRGHRLHRLRPRRRATKAAGSGSTTPRRSSATAGSCSARTRHCCRATAISTTNGSSPRANGASRSTCPRGRGRVRLGVSICEDLWDEFYDIKPLAELAAKGAELLLNLNASPFCPGKRHDRDRLIRAHIRRARQADSSTSTPPARRTTARTSSRSTAKASSTTRAGRLSRSAGSSPRNCSSSMSSRGAADRRRCRCPPMDRDREMYDALVMALRDYMRKTGFTRAIVAVSGGIDSALALAIAVDALGAGPRVGLQHAVALQHRDDPVDRRPAGAAFGVALRRHSDPGRSTSTSAKSSKRTPIRSRRASPARICTRASAAC